MIGELAANLVTKIKQVTSLGVAPNQRVGLTVGGTESDPTLSSVQMPAAWIIFVGDQAIDANDQGDCAPYIRYNFAVKVLVDNTSESALTSISMPLLEEIISVVNSQASVVGAKKWRYEGQSIDEISGQRLVFEQRFSVTAIL